MAQEFADGRDDHNFLDLHVRGGSWGDKKKNEREESFVLGFKYRLPGTSKKQWDDQFHKMRQIIIDHVGDKNLIRWSISTPTVIIKQVAL